MNDNRVEFKSGELTLEGLLSVGGRKGAVLAHPHPLLGGNMRDHVLMAMSQALNEAGYTTLRFNFRGIGRSEGFFDNGIAEQEDLKSAVNYLKLIGYGPVLLAGYSFGAWVSSKVSMSDDLLDDISGLIMVSPPITEMTFDFEYAGVDLVITGDSDPFCPLDSLAGYSAANGFKVAVVHGADHFYFGKELELMDRLKSFLKKREEE
jgi:uncharacterized protein